MARSRRSDDHAERPREEEGQLSNPAQRRLSPADIDDLISAYQAGATIRDRPMVYSWLRSFVPRFATRRRDHPACVTGCHAPAVRSNVNNPSVGTCWRWSGPMLRCRARVCDRSPYRRHSAWGSPTVPLSLAQSMSYGDALIARAVRVAQPADIGTTGQRSRARGVRYRRRLRTRRGRGTRRWTVRAASCRRRTELRPARRVSSAGRW